MAEFRNVEQKFIFRGLKLNAQGGILPPEKYQIAKNVRSYTDGVVQARPGLSSIATAGAAPMHSVRRLNANVTGASPTSTRIHGAGTQVEYGLTGALTVGDTGYSGDPLSLVPSTPFSSAEAWMYVGDSAKMRKFRVNGTNYQWGIAPPLVAPFVTQSSPNLKVISDFDSTTSWANGGTAGAVSTQTRVNTTITSILYDRTASGGASTTGWALIQPAVLDTNIQPGMRLVVNSGGGTAEQVLVEDVLQAITTTTIGSIFYDSGTSGLCAIQLAAPSAELRLNSLVELGTGGGTAEKVRVLSVTTGPDGLTSFRCYSANTHAAAEVVTGVKCLRAYCTANHAAAETLTSTVLQSTMTVGTGFISLPGALDLSIVGSRPIGEDDDIHISIKLDRPDYLVEGRVELDFNSATTTSLPALDANAFLQNYFYYPFRANDLIPAVVGTTSTLSAQQRAIQRQQVDSSYRIWSRQTSREIMDGDAYFPAFTDAEIETVGGQIPDEQPNQTGTGESQWTELRFKVKDLVRVGTDMSRGLKDVAAIRVQLQVSNTVVGQADSWWVGGTYGPDNDSSAEFPYYYCYRGRSSLTGAKGNASPPNRSGITSSRMRQALTFTQHPDAQVDKLDIYRFGGTLNEWHLLASIPNSAAPTFSDDIPDENIVSTPLLEMDNFQPFPQADVPRSGVCDVAGTTVSRVSGDNFNTQWARGSVIFIDGQAYSLYNSPLSSTKLELEESAGTKSAVSWYAPQPTLLGQPLQVVWGPYGEGRAGTVLFAVGSATQPGALFWTKGNDPDSAPESNWLEITSSSEPLMGGCIYDGQPFVFSTERMFSITPLDNGFVAQPVAHSLGLASKWGVCVGEHIYFIGKDGIYESDGGISKSITDEDLYPIFPHDGQDGVAVGGVQPPDYTTYANTLRLSTHNGLVYFDYRNPAGAWNSLVYDTRTQGWSQDIYTVHATPGNGVVMHYGDEGVSNLLLAATSPGALAQATGSTDLLSTPISSQLRPGWGDFGDSRSDKSIGDMAVDIYTATANVTATAYFNEDSLANTPATLSNSSRGQVIVETIPGGQLARTISMDLTWTSGAVRIYGWSVAVVPKVAISHARWSDWTDDGYAGAKFIQGLVMNADTLGAAKSLQVVYDEGAVGASFNATHAGEVEKPYSFTPFIAHNLRMKSVDTLPWRPYSVRWIWEPAPELTTSWITQGTTHDLPGFQHLRDCYLALQSTAPITLVVNVDGVDFTYTIPSTGGAYQKIYLPFQVMKGKLFTYSLTSSSGFRLYQRDSQVRVKAWGDNGPYRTYQPFGDLSRINGARI